MLKAPKIWFKGFKWGSMEEGWGKVLPPQFATKITIDYHNQKIRFSVTGICSRRVWTGDDTDYKVIEKPCSDCYYLSFDHELIEIQDK